MLNDMSEAWRLTLEAAAAREDRLLKPPGNARGAAAKTIAGKLIGAGWAKEIKAPKHAPIWRRDGAGGGIYALKLTARGLKAIAELSEQHAGTREAAATAGVEKPAPEGLSRQQEHLPAAEVAAPDDGRRNGAVTSSARAPRGGSKLDRVLVMLSAKTGATVAELMSATGWLDHSMRAALTGLRRRGYELSLTRGERDGASVYRTTARSGEEAK